MALLINQIFNMNRSIIRKLHTTTASCAGARYRESIEEERHWNRSKALATSPDWSYLDGRPAPLNIAQKRRYTEQVNHNKRIQQLLYLVDNAKATVAQNKIDEEKSKQQIIASKLQPKNRVWHD